MTPFSGLGIYLLIHQQAGHTFGSRHELTFVHFCMEPQPAGMTVAFKGHTDLPIIFRLQLYQVVQVLLGGLLQWAS